MSLLASRRTIQPLASIYIWAAITTAVHAGVYNTAEDAVPPPPPSPEKFRELLMQVRSIGFEKVDFDNQMRKRYALWDALGGNRTPTDLTLEQKLNFSAVLIRRKRSQEAVRFLEPIIRQHAELFLFDAHLALAYWTSGLPGNDRRALEIQNQLLGRKGWPEHLTDFNDEQRNFVVNSIQWSEHELVKYRRAETFLLKLMKLRLAESPRTSFESVDALFDDGGRPPQPVKFVGEKGVFEPGVIATAERKKLPADAMEIVQQLLLWLPEDLRLYWLFAELCNARGDAEAVKVAWQSMDDLVFNLKVRAGDLRDRRGALKEFLRSREAEPPTIADVEDLIKKDEKKNESLVAMNPRTMIVTFASGVVVGLFALWQFQELRRRRRGG